MIKGLRTDKLTVDGSTYILTLGTGERSYGSKGGTLAFAYDAGEFSAAIERVNDYQDLCDTLMAIDNDEELRRIAIVAAAREEYRVTIAGSCKPVLSDDEYELVRSAADAVAR